MQPFPTNGGAHAESYNPFGFPAFRMLDILLVKQNGQLMLCHFLNLRPAQEQVIPLLRPQVKDAICSVRKVQNVG